MTAINHNGMIDFYIWSGFNINILDTINLVWKKASPIGTQNMGLEITSILLPDNKIIFLDSSTGSLAETTTGTIPPKKDGGSAVLGLDAENYSYYPVQDTVQLPVPASLINNDIDRNRNENSNNNYQTERNNYYPGQEIVQQPEVINNDINRNRNESNYYPGQEIVQPPAPATIINTSYNHGRESVPIANDEIQILKQEIQDLKQIILQNNKQSTSSTSNN
ncbi:unnamed protein product [Rhizophagus irregularis]|nr:unnamed protein product [Rhizophagus irregularis]